MTYTLKVVQFMDVLHISKAWNIADQQVPHNEPHGNARPARSVQVVPSINQDTMVTLEQRYEET